VNRNFHELGVYNVDLQLYLFDSLVSPILNSSCVIWGPYMLKGKNITMTHECELWHRSHLKQLLGVCKSTTTHVVMEELKRHPLCFAWLKQSLKFWNKIMMREADDLVRMALIESTTMTKGWVSDLNHALKNLGCCGRASAGAVFDVDLCLEEAKAAWAHKYTTNHISVRECGSQGFKSIKYAKWFANNVQGSKSSFTRVLNRPDQIKIVAQFRTSSHWLNSEKQRGKGKSSIPRPQRVCKLCQYNQCEDEMHLFECPFYNDIRLKFHRLFSTYLVNKMNINQPDLNLNLMDYDITVWNLDLSDDGMNSLMNGDGSCMFWTDLANYLLACKSKRSLFLNC